MAAENKQQPPELKKPAPEVTKPVRNNMIAWGLGLLGLLAMGIGMAAPGIPVLGAVGAVFVGLGMGGFGIFLGLAAAFVFFRLLLAATQAKETASTAKKVAVTFFKAAFMAGIMFCFSYFILPLLMPHLAALTGLKFLAGSFFTQTNSVLSIVMLSVSALFTFIKTLTKGEGWGILKENPGRAVEVVIGMGLTVVAVLSFVGVLHLPLIAVAAMLFAGVTLALGLVSTVAAYASAGKAPAEAAGTEMAHLAANPNQGALPTPANQFGVAPTPAPTPAANVTPTQPSAPSHPGLVAQQSAQAAAIPVVSPGQPTPSAPPQGLVVPTPNATP